MTRRIGARGIGAAGTFLPSMISGLRFWFRADMGITVTGSGVSAWVDQALAGGAQDLAQGTDANRPPFVASDAALGNRPTVDPDGTSDRLQAATAADFTFLHNGVGCTIVVVFRATGAADSQTLLATFGPDVNGPGVLIDYHGTVTDYARFLIRNAGATVYSQNTGNNTVVDGSAHVVACRYQEGRAPAEIDLRLDGVQKDASDSVAAPAAGAPVALMVGARPFTAPDSFGSCPVAEIMAWDRAIATSDLMLVEAYCRARYRTP